MASIEFTTSAGRFISYRNFKTGERSLILISTNGRMYQIAKPRNKCKSGAFAIMTVTSKGYKRSHYVTTSKIIPRFRTLKEAVTFLEENLLDVA